MFVEVAITVTICIAVVTSTVIVQIRPLAAVFGEGILFVGIRIAITVRIAVITGAEVESFGGDVSVSVNGVPAQLPAGQTTQGIVRELVSFAEGSSELTVNLYAVDQQGEERQLNVTYYRDSQAPIINLISALQPVPAENPVVQYPYPLSGIISETNLASVTINDQPVSVESTSETGVYQLSVGIELVPGISSPVLISARDFAGNTTSVEYSLLLDSSASLTVLVPQTDIELYSDGSSLQQQLATRVEGSLPGYSVRGTLYNEQQETVSTITLESDNELASGDISVPSETGEYRIDVELLDASQNLVSKATRNILVKATETVAMELLRVEPAAGERGVEPSSFIGFFFNKPVDVSELQISVYETAHGFTYEDQSIPGETGTHSKGHQLIQVHRDHESVSGGLSILPGETIIAFYPEQSLAYNADVFVELSYQGEEVYRGLFHTRTLPTFIEGGLMDQLQQPIGGMQIIIPALGRKTTTHANGTYSFGFGDSEAQSLPEGFYDIVFNPDMRDPRYSTISKEIRITGGERNHLGVSRLPLFDRTAGRNVISSGQSAVILAKGELTLDLSAATLHFPDARDQGSVQAQFMEFSQFAHRTHPDFTPFWAYSILPGGIDIEGTVQVDFQLPKLDDSYDYLPEEGSLVLLVGLNSATQHIEPVGVGEIYNYRVRSLGEPEFNSLDYVGYVQLPADVSDLYQLYLDGEFGLRELTAKLPSASQQISAADSNITSIADSEE